jgi:CO dehydrogenase/acetyl-CoA synthase gamma subunit (corrinoid Fe-S protein)
VLLTIQPFNKKGSMSRIISVISAPAIIRDTSSELTFANHWDHFLARVGYQRGDHRVTPGLYRIGRPDETSPVFVSANYSLSFDALRSVLTGIDGYILVLDTRGVNVWCAAGKHTFGTREIARRVKETDLVKVVSHRKLILPQLGAPGVSAHEVRRLCGFTVEYGPVRAADLPEYLKTHQATLRCVK